MACTGVKLDRKLQVLMKVETTCGSYEELGAADGTIRVWVGATVEPDWQTEDRDIARATLTRLGKLTGTQATNISFTNEINSADVVTNDYEYKDALEGCSLTIQDLKGIQIGAVSGGPYTRGETVTDDSGNTARVVKETATGETWLYHDPISGTLQNGESLLGSASGATATTESATANHGHIVKPISSNQQSLSMEYNQDGYAWQAAGAMGTLIARYENSKSGKYEFTFNGVEYFTGDEALTTGITYNSDQPAILQSCDFEFNSTTVVVNSMEFQLNNTVVLRPDANASSGFIAAYISGRDPKVIVNMELPTAATLDVYAFWAAGTKVPVKWQLGTVKGKTHMFFADLCQVTNITKTETDGIVTLDVELSLTGAAGSGDDEFEWIDY